MNKPALVKGTRDFGPEEYWYRHFIINTVRQTYERYGFQPLETPAMELLETLRDSYGEEGDKLIFRILDSGDFMEKVPYPKEKKGSWAEDGLPSAVVGRYISEKALRYDLTVPFARYVSMHAGQITFPFKRYQIQPVWRADRPQKGRYREFYQCDADVIGSDSLLYEAEFLAIFHEVFDALSLRKRIKIRINHRGLLQAFSRWASRDKEAFSTFCTLWDKADKIPLEKLIPEFQKEGFDPRKVEKMAELRARLMQEPFTEKLNDYLIEFAEKEEIDFSYNLQRNQAQYEARHKKNYPSDQLLEVIQQARLMHGNYEYKMVVTNANVCNYYLDISLARGLDYYTGFIFEATPVDGGGSLAGGGRYDNLTGRFGRPGLSGVGISFGADRILDYIKDKELLKNIPIPRLPRVLISNMEAVNFGDILRTAQLFRSHNIPTEVYPEKTRLKKQIEYAVRKNIPFFIILGPEEVQQGVVGLKDIEAGRQVNMLPEEAVTFIQARHA
jgi:histidyl-tRNA synthetase